ncbi:bifunctional protein HldE [Psychrosphaera saromensis]|uniref:Bifunctional protein HldE n=1 Tax=Psychrosphaera saromensis TaxID=716813 RepID=A0A2S7USJ5_9GAMM|nr:bifunctional D-glycero-beta-D-manno-heptose-7-phosphate kinase/D-glycero-beta-D-manno-heptose 1-phosphate adenylyltransferase HldE [Psychrosphaera saromensis]PQJ52718.1 bifunctional heptose 7-phosphate kinase/heptose 1-phosphate adenyltransferase [Psychrosphaera saromensis]GHB70675.1 bifunctional protein HldE [Psychrosphaera saromensis]GLQ13203.1 bifunctional protein HldE [Psychrosphaera saromensis]
MFDLSIFNHLSDVKILVVGDVMLDRYWTGDSKRISPEAPVPVVKISGLDDKVGGAANVALNIARLDGQVTLLGIIGDDENGDRLEQLLTDENINSALIRQTEQPTITKLRVISRQQQVVRLDFEEQFSIEHAKSLQQKFEHELDNFDFILFSDYAKGSLACIKDMIATARAAGKTVLIDPKSKDLSDYAGANVITPNKDEFIAAGGQVHSEDAIWQSAQDVMTNCNIESILLTRSEQGMSAITRTKKVDMPAQVLEVSDVTGAGDTVIATLAMMMAAGLELADAAKIANLAAGVVVAKLGAATVSPEELYRVVNKNMFESKQAHYQTPFDEVLKHIEFARQSGEKIVFTNGCFDILHAGHVHYLEQAKALGDRLVVGLNNDDSITRLKGPTRPVNPLKDRATVISGLASVDWVIPFGELNGNQYDDTPFDIIQKVNPDILVKGGDYTPETIVGADFVQAQGGQVAVIEFVDGCSTTKIIEKIQQK